MENQAYMKLKFQWAFFTLKIPRGILEKLSILVWKTVKKFKANTLREETFARWM